ncbi:hypothetical protein MIND_00110100 [Mycena indigotica]|uniref:Uncharacterized protein n=1 Tax=Mycena indigotica TaxID=2126181 RepID=A0A8H6WIB0_9AGAR|nr:uncharacterized protein MIND_00110100 [Mycena indigotica]KAF7315933.1 hypothetical protein MIND_00110100 [Mycena indigotica]
MSEAAATASSTTTTRSSPAVAPIDLRHMTSNSALVADGRRISQHLQPSARKGSRSPTSIPSSPTSVHSSSSAIFERDIEPIHLSPSSIVAKKDPHRIPRSKNTESIEQSVPSVLDSAASILASMDTDDGDSIAVIAPAPLSSTGLLDQGPIRSRSSGFASPIGFRSRSPSPSPRPGGAKRNSLLLNLPAAGQHPAFPSPPGSSSPSSSSAPLTATARQFVDPSTPTSNKRLSFISYTDLLSSTPTATQPLSSLTSPASSPGHIPGVALADSMTTAGSAYGGSAAPSLRNFAFGLSGDEDRTMDDVGGEWEREGLGKGLEERLEALQSVGMA